MDHTLPTEVTKYLSKYSSNKWTIQSNVTATVTTVIVIPAIKEYENLQKLLLSLIKNNSEYFSETLILFVINNGPSSSEEVKGDNRESIELLKSIIYKNNINTLVKDVASSGLQVAFVDVSSSGLEIPEKDAGVGYARKIGMDLALTVFDYSSPKKKIILCLDADCTVKENYIFEVIKNFNQKKLSAATVKFEHQASGVDENAAAIVCYEIFMRYYVVGLRFAGSQYAFHTVGSTIACDYESYIKAEGMNKRKAAEDFYFLEKLAKNISALFEGKAAIPEINSTTVFPSSRGSWRVPFGTGQRVSRFISKTRDEYLLHDPGCFVILKKWLELFFSNEILNCTDSMDRAQEIHPALKNFLVDQKFEEGLKKLIDNSKTGEQLKKQKIRWFDGFRTMKLIHYLRDNVYPDKNMFDALDQFFVLLNLSPGEGIVHDPGAIPLLDIQKKYLIYLREIDKE